MTKIYQLLLEKKDDEYAIFQRKLIPNIDPDTVIGVRTPDIKSLAKELKGTPIANAFLCELPHKYFEENQLHSFLLSYIKDYEESIKELSLFLPYVDNWATCDQLKIAAFKKHPEALPGQLNCWLKDNHPYTIRFAIEMFMNHYLDDYFSMEYAENISKLISDEYYVNMMIAWYFATALAKQYDSILPIIEAKTLPKWVHNKTIQKARESFRITLEQKDYLNSLKIK